MSHTDDSETVMSLNFITLIVFAVVLCGFCAICFIWDNDFWNYRAPREREFVIRHVIIRDGNEDYI